MILAGALSFIINEFINKGFFKCEEYFTFLGMTFLVLVILSIIALVCSTYLIIRGSIGYDYQVIPLAESINNDIENLKSYDEKIIKTKSEYQLSDTEVLEKYQYQNIEISYDEYLIKKFKDASTINSANNDIKDRKLYFALSCLFISFVFMFASFLLFFYFKLIY